MPDPAVTRLRASVTFMSQNTPKADPLKSEDPA